VTWHRIPEERSPTLCKISRNEFTESGLTQNHGGCHVTKSWIFQLCGWHYVVGS